MPTRYENGSNSTKNLPSYGLVTEVTPNFDVIKQGETEFKIDTTTWDSHFNIIRENHNIFTNSDYNAIMEEARYYNRFKIPNLNKILTKSYGHVFFMRPDLNIVKPQGGNDVMELNDNVNTDPLFNYVQSNNPSVIRNLSRYGYSGHFFSMMLSNAAKSITLQDEALKSDTYGDTWTGHKIPYGKHNTDSISASTFDVTYEDDNNLSIYQLHKLWIEYISRVYRGRICASDENIRLKCIDYATSVYYFLCAEDFETIIFWAKYTGVFPSNTPSATVGSWNRESPMRLPEYQITYQYAFKEEYNPFLFTEFNNMSSTLTQSYVNNYDTNLLGIGRTIVGPPYVEVLSDNGRYVAKLRFRKG